VPQPLYSTSTTLQYPCYEYKRTWQFLMKDPFCICTRTVQ
jgi:hypothetical protein